jgi:hypothetical protein
MQANKRSRKTEAPEARPDELGTDPGQVGSESAGQSGDPQGLSQVADAADESVEELADTGQAFEAEVIEGVEDAADHPEQPVRTHETPAWPGDDEPEPDSES